MSRDLLVQVPDWCNECPLLAQVEDYDSNGYYYRCQYFEVYLIESRELYKEGVTCHGMYKIVPCTQCVGNR